MINVHFVERFSEGDTDDQLMAMRRYMDFVQPEEAEVILCASILYQEQAASLARTYQKPIVVYCWDYYKWAHDGHSQSAHWQWQKYAELLKQASLVIVPSKAQQLRLKELLDLNSIVVHTGIRQYHETPTDGGFVLDPLRYYEPDENCHWAESAAKELGIPIIHSEHGYAEPAFRELVASCTFMTSCVREASTGALTLMEGLGLGKVSLVSDSPYMGASDYLGPLGVYFRYDSYEDLLEKMRGMWQGRPTIPLEEARGYLAGGYSFDAMANGIYEGIRSVL